MVIDKGPGIWSKKKFPTVLYSLLTFWAYWFYVLFICCKLQPWNLIMRHQFVSAVNLIILVKKHSIYLFCCLEILKQNKKMFVRDKKASRIVQNNELTICGNLGCACWFVSAVSFIMCGFLMHAPCALRAPVKCVHHSSHMRNCNGHSQSADLLTDVQAVLIVSINPP